MSSTCASIPMWVDLQPSIVPYQHRGLLYDGIVTACSWKTKRRCLGHPHPAEENAHSYEHNDFIQKSIRRTQQRAGLLA